MRSDPMKYFILLAVALLAPLTTAAQEPGGRLPNKSGQPKLEFGRDLLGGDLSLPGLGGGGNEIKLSAKFQIHEGDRTGILSLRAELEKGWHVYSVTQKKGGPMRTVLALDKEIAAVVELLGPFQPKQPPQLHQEEFYDVPSEEHTGEVIWTAPIRIAEGQTPEQLQLKATFNGQICSSVSHACVPIFNRTVKAEFSGYLEPIPAENSPATSEVAAEPDAGYRNKNGHVAIQGYITPKVVTPGSSAKLVLTATPDPTWHVYGHALSDPKILGKGSPTLIVLEQTEGIEAGEVSVSEPPSEHDSGLWHEQAVTWTVPLTIPVDAKPGEITLSGSIAYQGCLAEACDLPTAASFRAPVVVGEKEQAGETLLAFAEDKYRRVAEIAAVQSETSERTAPVSWFQALPDRYPIAFAAVMFFAGGLLLNVMPCVLPVIGLKILSFVEQAGHDRRRAFALNLWYSFGVLAVFMSLAVLVVAFKLALNYTFLWGQQNTWTAYPIVMSALVFAMALSFLGVWEIPIPGFASTREADKLQSKEGSSGAFFKGVFATVLATPCVGPFLGTAVSTAVQCPVHLVFVLFACGGLGMAAPYLILGAKPELLKWLPKPGKWMETFKQLMAFPLLATVVWISKSIHPQYFVSTFALLMGIWFACWWVGRIRITATPSRKALEWSLATLVAVGVGLFGFAYLDKPVANATAQTTHASNSEHALAWQPYNPDRLAELRADGKTVMIDFTAEWCATCQVNGVVAINTKTVKEKVEALDVAPMLADWTYGSPEIHNKLLELEQGGIPVLAIYPANKPDSEVIVLSGLVTATQVADALEQAGASQSSRAATETAMSH